LVLLEIQFSLKFRILKYVVPKLQAAGWEDDPHSIAEQRTDVIARRMNRSPGVVKWQRLHQHVPVFAKTPC
jgi:hypothetical protein